MIRLSHQPEEDQARLATLDREAIGQWEEEHASAEERKHQKYPKWKHYTLCILCKDAILGYEHWGPSKSKYIKVGYWQGDGQNTIGGPEARICPDCLERLKRSRFPQPGHKRVFPPEVARDLGDRLLDWLPEALTFYHRSNWDWSYMKGWVRKETFNVAPFIFEVETPFWPGDRKRKILTRLVLRTPERLGRFCKQSPLPGREDLQEITERFLTGIRGVFACTMTDHRKRFKAMLAKWEENWGSEEFKRPEPEPEPEPEPVGRRGIKLL